MKNLFVFAFFVLLFSGCAQRAPRGRGAAGTYKIYLPQFRGGLAIGFQWLSACPLKGPGGVLEL